jgi:signal transduction histidine kinase
MAKRPRLAAAAIAPIAAAAAAVAAIILHVVAPPGGPHLRFADLVTGTSFALAGVLVLRREPRNAAGRLLLAVAVLAFDPSLNEIAWRSRHGSVVAEASLWMTNWIWVLYLLLPTMLVLLLPDGQLPSRRWRPVAVAVGVVTVAAAICAMLRPGGSDQITSLDNPLGIGGASFLAPMMAVAAGLVFGLGGLVCVGGLLVRQRRANGVERAQLRWLAAGAAAAATAFAGSVAAPWPLGEVLLAAGLAALPAAIVVAMWRHRLYDADIVLNRAVASFVLTAAGLAMYALVVAVSDRAAPAAAAVIALIAAAGWGRAQRLTRRLLYGVRDDPLAVVERVGARIDAVGAPAQALQALAETVRDALRLPYIAVAGGEIEAAAGSLVATVDEFACIAGGRRVAVLVVGHRHSGERWRDEERTLLEDSARRAAALVQTGRLVADLERSRSSLVGAREEERRRLRRDLHDGVASALAGISLQLDCIDEGRTEGRPDAIAQIRESTRAVTSEVRALVHDLRPPSLDQLGLAAAVREHAAAWSGTMTVNIGSEPLPPLPAATEVAAYRIATEAIANAARHGAAHTCCVRLIPAHPWLLVEVEDDGSGFVESPSGGVGLDAMRARAAEVGGNLEVASQVGHGTRVSARLPLEIA